MIRICDMPLVNPKKAVVGIPFQLITVLCIPICSPGLWEHKYRHHVDKDGRDIMSVLFVVAVICHFNPLNRHMVSHYSSFSSLWHRKGSLDILVDMHQ